MSGPTSPGVPRRRQAWLTALVTVAIATAVVVIAWVVYWTYFAWPPLVSAGDSLGIVIEREGLLPAGGTWRPSDKSWAVRVFGVSDRVEQERLIEAVRGEMRLRGKPRGRDSLDIEFWSGEPPPRNENGSTPKPREGSAVLRTVKVP